MTDETRQKFFGLCHAVVSSMASEESLRDLFHAVVTTEWHEWPSGIKNAVQSVGVMMGQTITCCTIAAVNAHDTIDEPILVTNTQEEKP